MSLGPARGKRKAAPVTSPGTEAAEIALALRKSEERFRQVVESAPNAMVMINQRGLIEMVNTQAERLFGFTREEMLGQAIEILVPERFRATQPHIRKSF
jgi:PAS domain-containing protein